MFEFLNAIWATGGIVAFSGLAVIILAYILYRAFSAIADMQLKIQTNKNENQELIRKFAENEAAERRAVQEQLNTIL